MATCGQETGSRSFILNRRKQPWPTNCRRFRMPMMGLEPYLDAQTMRIHHQRHHAAYVKGLNHAIAGTAFEPMALPKLLSRLYRVPRHIRGAVRSSEEVTPTTAFSGRV